MICVAIDLKFTKIYNYFKNLSAMGIVHVSKQYFIFIWFSYTNKRRVETTAPIMICACGSKQWLQIP